MAPTAPQIGLSLQPGGLRWPEPPRFDSPLAEREHGKLRLAVAFRIFAMHGFDAGIAGHISYRDPVNTQQFWVNPLGVHFSRIRVSDLVLVDHAGTIIEGKHPINAAAYAIHSRIHAARPDVVAAAHSHSRYCTAFASLGQRLPAFTQEACAFHQDHALFDGYNGIAADVSEGELIARALGPTKAVICRHHGVFTVGQTIEEAVSWYLRMERSCEQALLAMAAGSPIEVDPAMAAVVRGQVGSPKAGWFGLQPLVDKVLAEQPDICT